MIFFNFAWESGETGENVDGVGSSLSPIGEGGVDVS